MTTPASGHSALRPRRVVIYARISDDREGRRYGVDRQVKDCRRLAEDNGDEVVAVFIDDDRSAYSGKKRVEYLKMLAYLREGHAEGVLALAPTRLYRRLDDGLEFFELINARGLRVETTKAGRFKLNTADGRRDALRAAIDAQYESELIGERVRDAKADNVARGEYRGGPRPFGFEGDGVTPRALLCLTPGCSSESGFDINRHCLDCDADAVNKPETEFWWIERGINGVIARESLRSMVREINNAGMGTPERRYKNPDGSKSEPVSRKWDENNFREMLKRPRNVGLIEAAGEVAGRAQWPAAVPVEDWKAALAILSDPSRRTSFSNARAWLLSGVAHCWCGSTVKCSTSGVGGSRRTKDPENPDGPPIVIVRGKSAPAYRCRATGGHVSRRAEEMDAYIEGLVIRFLARPDAAALLLPPAPDEQDEVAELAAEAARLQAKLEAITVDFNNDDITRPQMIAMTAAARARLDQVEARMAQRTSRSVLATIPLGQPEVVEAWKGYDIDRKRAIVDELMEITFKPGKRGRPPGPRGSVRLGFDPAAVEIRWKSGDDSE